MKEYLNKAEADRNYQLLQNAHSYKIHS